MQREAERRHPVKALNRVGILVLVCLAVGAICFLAGRFSGGKAEKELGISSVVLEGQMSQLSELASVSYAYTNMGQFESSNDFYGMEVPFTTRRFILAGNGVHIVTVNDYLAKRDSEWMGKVYNFLGLSVGLIIHNVDNAGRRAAYAADITYGTNNEMM